MESIEKYLLSVTAAAVICAVVTTLLGKKGTVATVGKLICSIFLALTVISPWASVQLGDLDSYFGSLSFDASSAVQSGQSAARDALRAGIKERTEAYILDKATALSAALTVEVTLSEEDPPVPCAAKLTGAVSPYAKFQIQSYLSDELGIPKEAQTWIS